MDSLMIFIISALVLFLAYVIFGEWMSRVWGINPRKKTPAREMESDGAYGCSEAPVAFGAQFAAFGCLGMIQGTIAAMRFGWLPALLWLLLGGIFLGGVQVYGSFFASVDQKGRTMGIMVEKSLGHRSGKWFQMLSFLCTVVILSVLLEGISGQLAGILPGEGEALIHNFQGGVLSMIVLLLYPISILLGLLNRLRCPVRAATLVGVILLIAGICTGALVPFYLKKEAWLLILMAASVLTTLAPVWLVTQPKNYLGSVLAIVLMVTAGIGICLKRPEMTVPAFTGWYVEEQGLFPWFIVALGAVVLSGYQAFQVTVLGARQVDDARNAKVVGYAPVLLQCMLGVMTLVIVGSLAGLGRQNGGKPLSVFTKGLMGLLERVVSGSSLELFAEIAIGLVLTVLMVSALECGVRTGSVALRELAAESGGIKKLFRNPLLSTMITAAAAFVFRYVKIQQMGEVLGIYLILLAVPVCFAVMVWQKRLERSSRLLWLPLTAAQGGVLATAGYFLVENVRIVLDKGVSRETTGAFVKIFLLALALIVSVMFIMDGVRGYMKKRKIIFATGNAGKMREIREILGDLDGEILSLKEAGIEAEIEENGSTFEENAIIKAKAICEMTGCLVLADDSGLEIDYLNKEPGILSARYMGEDTPYTIKNNKLIERLEGVPEEERTARFVCVIAAAFPDGKVETTRGTMEGYIGYEERGENGFGYDPIFFLKEYECSSAELSMEEKNKISHRGKALRAMKEKLV